MLNQKLMIEPVKLDQILEWKKEEVDMPYSSPWLGKEKNRKKRSLINV